MSDQDHPEWPTADNDANNPSTPNTGSQPKNAAGKNKPDTPEFTPKTVTHPTPEPPDPDTSPASDTARLVLGEPTEPTADNAADQPPTEVTPEAEEPSRATPSDETATVAEPVAKDTEPTAGDTAQPTAEQAADLPAGGTAERADADTPEPATRNTADLAAGGVAELAAGNAADVVAGNWAEPAAGNAAELAAGNTTQVANGDWAETTAESTAGTMAELASGDWAEPTAEDGAEPVAGDTARFEFGGATSPSGQPAPVDQPTLDHPAPVDQPAPADWLTSEPVSNEPPGPADLPASDVPRPADLPSFDLPGPADLPADEPPRTATEAAKTAELPVPYESPGAAEDRPVAGDTAKLVLGESTKRVDGPTPTETRETPETQDPRDVQEVSQVSEAPEEPTSSARTIFTTPVDQEPGWLFTPQTPPDAKPARDSRDTESPGWLFVPQDPPEVETPPPTWPDTKAPTEQPKAEQPPTSRPPAKPTPPAQPTQPLESPSWPAARVPTESGRVDWPKSPGPSGGDQRTVETPSWPATRVPTEPPTVSGLAPVQPPGRPKTPDVDKDRTVVARPVAPPQKPQQQKPQQPPKPPPRQDSTAERTVVTRPVAPPEPKQRSYTEEATKRIQVPEPPRAAPVRIEPTHPRPKAEPRTEPKPKAEARTETPEPRRSRKKLLLIGGAIVLVLALAGGALAIPGVRAKLGFTGTEPDLAIQPPPSPVAFTPTLKGPSAEAPTPTQEGVRNALAGPASAAALGTFNGVVIDPATGKHLWEQRATTPITPASTAKILTSAAALLKMDRGTQFATKVVAGKDPGSVVLVGGGDPTVSSLPAGKNSVYPGAAHLDDLVAQVKASGTKVTTVYFDTSRYTGDGLTQGWLPGDVQGGYIAPIVPLMMDGDRRNPAEVDTPRTNTPAKNIAAELAKRLGASLAGKPEAVAAPDAKVLGEIRSAPLAELIDNYLEISDNVLAETVARELAKSVGEEPSFAGVSRTTLKVLQENNFDITGVKLIDGSGLSTVDVVTPTLLASILAVAAAPDGGKDPRTAKLRPLLGGLPVAGGSGTLEGRFGPNAPGAGGRGWVRAKTGTLSGVNSLAGVVLDADGRVLVFSMMTSGTDANGARPALDAVAAALRGCGCK